MKVLVTGGGGFLGQAIIALCLSRNYQVSSYSRRRYPHLEKCGVINYIGEISNLYALLPAVKGVDAVFHVAAKAGVWGADIDYYQTNVIGTEQLIHACLTENVQRLIYTSSPSVVHHGDDIEGANESLPYATSFLSAYPDSKAQAEQIVLNANCDQLATVALRPHLIWGPGDNHLLPRIAARAKSGRLRFIGDPDKKIDSVFINNAAEAHLCALDALKLGSRCSGNAYFISNGEPMTHQALVNGLLNCMDMQAVDKRIPKKLAYTVALLLETIYSLLAIKKEPPLTRFMVDQLSSSHWFDISAAKRDLNFTPNISIPQGMAILKTWYRESTK